MTTTLEATDPLEAVIEEVTQQIKNEREQESRRITEEEEKERAYCYLIQDLLRKASEGLQEAASSSPAFQKLLESSLSAQGVLCLLHLKASEPRSWYVCVVCGNSGVQIGIFDHGRSSAYREVTTVEYHWLKDTQTGTFLSNLQDQKVLAKVVIRASLGR